MGEEEDPWQKLSPHERKRAERHLMILYVVMGTMVIGPLVLLFFFRK
jgi:hypothetical protein